MPASGYALPHNLSTMPVIIGQLDPILVQLVKAKMEGRKIMPPKAPEPTKPSDLMEALRQSAKGDSDARAEKRKAAPRKAAKSKTTKRRKVA